MVRGERIGLVIAGTSLTVSMTRDQAPVWKDLRDIPPQVNWADFLDSVLEAVPRGRRSQSVCVLLDAPYAQHRALHGVATTATEQEVNESLLREPHGFFLGEPTRWMPTGALFVEGDWLAGVLDREIVEAVAAATSSSQRTFLGAAPAIAPCADSNTNSSLTERAIAVANGGAELPFLLDPERAQRFTAQARRRSLALGLLLLAAGASACLAPTWAIQWQIAHEEGALRKLRSSLLRLSNASPITATTRAAIAHGAPMASESRELVELVARLAAELPDSAAIIALRVDSMRGSATILAPVSVSPLRAVASTAGIVRPRVIGAVTREVVEGSAVQRTVIAFERPPRRRVAFEYRP